ncbi:hypothetical protein [Methanobrevibacter curvatus]|uniref:Uncharacterized protein n=1 Tax=Methanobrevibacter curvatus TaxID=49547 RepID=A0A166E987_9EURY|nr:hypothetical protein [Methanobrevibacter curvatus]KZX16411.1 hypothetical protein MBCUR_00750 [Methanobrevibacter curvatus]
MVKKEILIPILSIILIFGVFFVASEVQKQEIMDEKNAIEFSDFKANFAIFPYSNVYDGNVSGVLKSNKTFNFVYGEIVFYDENKMIIGTTPLSISDIYEDETYYIHVPYYGNDNKKPAHIKIIIYNNDGTVEFKSHESILYENSFDV